MTTVTPTPPDMPLQQRLDALERANLIRTRRAQLKRDLKARNVEIRDILTDPPLWIATMKVADLLLAVQKFGHAKVNKILKRCGVSPSKTVAGLNDRQRHDSSPRCDVTPSRPGGHRRQPWCRCHGSRGTRSLPARCAREARRKPGRNSRRTAATRSPTPRTRPKEPPP